VVEENEASCSKLYQYEQNNEERILFEVSRKAWYATKKNKVGYAGILLIGLLLPELVSRQHHNI
jgi:hypothetical protein